jgi:hypothetical protein
MLFGEPVPGRDTMPYEKKIHRANPGLLVLLLDQSWSMTGAFGGSASGAEGQQRISKAQGLASAVNNVLTDTVTLCSDGDQIRHYFDVAVLGYGAQHGVVAPALGGMLASREMISITELGESPLGTEEQMVVPPEASHPVKVPMGVWCRPVGGGDTPMCKALNRARDLVDSWISKHPSAFPPIVLNLTDGESTDGDPLEVSQRITRLATDDGNVLLFNCHISSVQADPVLFPEREDRIPDQYGQKLFQMSSQLPTPIIERAQSNGFQVGPSSRGLVFQAGHMELARFLDVGTPKAIMRR